MESLSPRHWGRARRKTRSEQAVAAKVGLSDYFVMSVAVSDLKMIVNHSSYRV